MTLHELQRRLDGFNLPEIIVETINATDTAIARLIRTQMAFGIKGSSGQIQNVFTKKYDYSLWWGDHRKTLGLQIDFFDFKVTGEFYRSIGVFKVSSTSFDIYARSSKTSNLVKLFTDNIFNLTDDSLNEYIQDSFFPELQRRIENKLGKVFGS
jgi:hypothetical protein